MKAQAGLGVDIVEIARMARILERTPSFATRTFSEAEQAYCDSMSNRAAHYATRFAAKEAVLKALGVGFTCGITPRDVEVGRASNGRPYCILHGRAQEVAAEMGVTDLPISLSYTHVEAVACAMALTPETEVANRVDPMAELTQQFKEARAMLDSL